MFIVGLTGGIATGKSTVCDIFREYSIPVIDADKIARQVVEPGEPAWHKIRNEFGEEVFDQDGYLNRARLGDIIFNDIDKRKILNGITHPEIYKKIRWQMLKYFFQGYPFIVIDLPLLFETGKMLSYLHKIIVVTCDDDLQLERLMKRSEFTEEKAKQRIATQMPQKDKIERANFVIENSGTRDEMRCQTIKIINCLQSLKYHWRIRIIIGFCCIVLLLGLSWIISPTFMKSLFFIS